jgi:uncharacterized protein (DUF362 family)
MKQKKNQLSRRAYLKTLGAGALGTGVLGGIGMGMMQGCDSNASMSAKSGSGSHLSYEKREDPVTVSLVKGDDRRKIVYQSMMNLKDEIVEAIGKKKVLIKINMVVANSPGCETHPDAVRGVIDFLRDHTKAEVIVGESTADRNISTMKCFEGYNYFPLREEYGIELVDLNKGSFENRFMLGAGNTSVPVRVISALMDPDVFLISLARMKVHCHAYVTLSLKNVLMAAPLNDQADPEKGWANGDKFAMHVSKDSPPTDPLFYNLFLMSQHVYPDLSVIDGFEGMSGRGPTGGKMVDSRVAVASLDALAADVMGTKVMGLDPEIVPYFNFIKEAGIGQGDMKKINVIGTPLADCIYQFKACRSFDDTSELSVMDLFHPEKDPHTYEA